MRKTGISEDEKWKFIAERNVPKWPIDKEGDRIKIIKNDVVSSDELNLGIEDLKSLKTAIDEYLSSSK